MKRAVLYGLAGVAAPVIVAAVAPLLLPASIYKGRIEDSVTRATGRKFTIAGPLHFNLFPAFAIRANQVTLANIPGGYAQNFAAADDIRLEVQLWPLLSGRLELTRVVLDKPVIGLESEMDGHANWIFERPSRAPPESRSGTGFTTQISTIEIVDGRIRYSNFRTGGTRAIDDVHATIQFGQSNGAAHAVGTFALNGQPVDFKTDAAISAMDSRTLKTSLSLSSDLLDAQLDGTLNPNGFLDGDVSIQTSNARAAGIWLGAEVPNINGLGALSLQSHVRTDEHAIMLGGLKARLDGMSIGGDISIDTHGRVPRVEGTMRVDHLNVNPYIQHARKAKASPDHGPDDVWSREPITLDVLKAIDARLTVSAGDVSVRNLTLGRTEIHVDLADSDLTASLAPMMLYGGTGTASLRVNAKYAVPTFHNTLDIKDVALDRFLSDTIGVKHIEGIGKIRLDIASTGTNPNAIMCGISGRGALAFRNGRIQGVDLGAVARTIQTLSGTAISSDAVTAYRTMKGSFTATNGVLTNEDLQVAGPLLTARGSGTIGVCNRAIDFRIVPQASAVIANQKLTVGLPFRITGPWKHVHYKANLSGLAKSVIDNLKSGKAPFKGLFGSSKPKDLNAPKKKHKGVEDALKNMLGIH